MEYKPQYPAPEKLKVKYPVPEKGSSTPVDPKLKVKYPVPEKGLLQIPQTDNI